MFDFAHSLAVKVRLQRFLECRSRSDADRLLEQLLADPIRPLVQRRLRRRTLNADEKEIVSLMAEVETCDRLEKARLAGKPDGVRSLEGLTRLLTDQAFCRYLEEKRPQRRQLKFRVEYLFDQGGCLAKWKSANAILCGLALWKGLEEASQQARWDALLNDPAKIVGDELGLDGAERKRLGILVPALLVWAESPVPLETLVNIVGEIQGVDEIPLESDSSEDSDSLAPIDVLESNDSPEQTALDRDYLRCVWAEIGHAPVKQRKALLMDMRDVDPHPIDQFVVWRIARHAQVAEMFEMTLPEYALIKAVIPMEDIHIARHLDTTHGNVRVLRNTLRNRLIGRMKDTY